MQLFSLLLLALSAGALPQTHSITKSEAIEPDTTIKNPSTPPTLEKRANAWVGSFTDPKCQGSHIGEGDYRPKMTYSTCHAFKLQKDVNYISIYYGTRDDRISNMYFYADDKCQTGPVYNMTVPDKGDWWCFSKDEFHGAEVVAISEEIGK